MSHKVFVLDDYRDRVSARGEKGLANDEEWRRKWHRGPMLKFPTELQAWQYAEARAVIGVEKAKNGLRKAESRVKKLQKRIASLEDGK